MASIPDRATGPRTVLQRVSESGVKGFIFNREAASLACVLHPKPEPRKCLQKPRASRGFVLRVSKGPRLARALEGLLAFSALRRITVSGFRRLWEDELSQP